MPSSSAVAAKIFTKPKFKMQYEPLTMEEWNKLEELWKSKILSAETREKIDVVNSIYSGIGPLHAPTATATISKVEKSLNAWVKATARLRKSLGANETSGKSQTKEQIVHRFATHAAAAKIDMMPPVVFAQYVIEAGMGAALLALEEIKQRNMALGLKRDLWLAWVMYLAKLATEAGIKISASSANKVKDDSPFVSGIRYLQAKLPGDCHHYNGYESTVKGINAAKQKFGKHSPSTLLAIIAAWGANLPGFNSHNQADAEAIIKKMIGGNG
jgi:hypothetical protein